MNTVAYIYTITLVNMNTIRKHNISNLWLDHYCYLT